MRTLEIFRLLSCKPCLIGRISPNESIFEYDASYLESPDAQPLSLSLPLRREPFKEAQFKPYFEGLIAEGAARQTLAAELQTSESDYLSILELCGRECIGDIVVHEEGQAFVGVPESYEALSKSEFKAIARWQTKASLLVSPSQEPKTKSDWRTCRQPPWTKAGSDLKDSRGRLTY